MYYTRLTASLATIIRANNFTILGSRRLIYLRFAEQHGTSIRAAIEKRRLSEVEHLLQTTRPSTEVIATRCGYANPNVLRNLFKRTFAVSMREYRRSLQNH